MATKQKPQNLEKKIMDLAKACGVDDNYFFTTTFDRYQVQIKILDKLKTAIENEPTLITKEYVKNRENKYTHPAIAEFNKTSNAANQTAQTLIKIITAFRDGEAEEDDKFIDFWSKGK